MFDNVGVAFSSGVVSAMIVSASVIPTVCLQWKGHIWRQKREEKTST